MVGDGIFRIFISLSLVLASGNLGYCLSIEHIALHPSYALSSGGPENEDGPADAGGTLFVLVRNGSATESVALDPDATRINGTIVGSISTFRWAQALPDPLPPGGRGMVRVKSIGVPFATGQRISVEVNGSGGATATASVHLVNSPVTIGHVIASQDFRSLRVFVRNLSAADAQVVEVLEVDGVNYSATLLGGPILPPNGIGIAVIAPPGGFSPMQVVNVYLCTAPQEGGKPGGRAAVVRLTEPRFFTGSNGADWNESLVRQARQWFGHEIVLPGHFSDNGSTASRYDLRSTPIVFNGTPPAWDDLERLKELEADPGNYAYYLADEPDLKSGAAWSAPAIARGVRNILANDPATPMFLNLAKNKSFQEFGMLADHPSFDHYAQFAPLVYSNGRFSSTHSIKDAFRYTGSLKLNCEPLRQWCFAQGVDAVWDTQPHDWGIKVQFWNHVMGGTKGILFFSAQPQYVINHAAQKTAIEWMLKQMSLVRWLLAYGDVAGSVTTSHPDLLATAVVSERAMVVPVTNSSGTFTRSLFGTGSATMSEINGQSVEFDVPSWIPLERVREVGPDGFSTPSHTISGRTVTVTSIHTDTKTPHRVYLVGEQDTHPPASVQGLNVAAMNGDTAVLSWRMPFDDTGIKGYKVFRDGAEIGDVRTPYLEGVSHSASCAYHVLAYDGDGNMGTVH